MSVFSSPVLPGVDLTLFYSMEHYRFHYHCYTYHHDRCSDAATSVNHSLSTLSGSCRRSLLYL